MRTDEYLRTKDLELRLFVEYCRQLQDLYEEAVMSSMQAYGIKSRSVHDISGDRPHTDGYSMRMIDRKDAAFQNYISARDFVKRISKKFPAGDSEKLNLLYLRYERLMSLREIGDVIGYSYMQVQRKLDEILLKM